MPKPLPGASCEFVITKEDGTIVSGRLKALPEVLPFRLARKVKTLLRPAKVKPEAPNA